jgi:hypothetical protein
MHLLARMFFDEMKRLRCSQPATICHLAPLPLPPAKRYTDAETPSVATPDAPHFSTNVHSTDASSYSRIH